MVDREPSMPDGEHVAQDEDENSRVMGPGATPTRTEDLQEELQRQLKSVNSLRQSLQERAQALEEERSLEQQETEERLRTWETERVRMSTQIEHLSQMNETFATTRGRAPLLGLLVAHSSSVLPLSRQSELAYARAKTPIS